MCRVPSLQGPLHGRPLPGPGLRLPRLPRSTAQLRTLGPAVALDAAPRAPPHLQAPQSTGARPLAPRPCLLPTRQLPSPCHTLLQLPAQPRSPSPPRLWTRAGLCLCRALALSLTLTLSGGRGPTVAMGPQEQTASPPRCRQGTGPTRCCRGVWSGDDRATARLSGGAGTRRCMHEVRVHWPLTFNENSRAVFLRIML